jgi:hypothetical protein
MYVGQSGMMLDGLSGTIRVPNTRAVFATRCSLRPRR